MSKTVAFLLHSYFEQSEYAEVDRLLKDKGYNTVLITTNDDKQVQAMEGDVEKVGTYNADLFLKDANVDDYDAIVLPGGTVNADTIRQNQEAQRFVKQFYDANKTVAAICHAPWLLVNTGLVKGKTLTAYPSLQTDINNAGGTYVDKQVQQDGVIITSRNPDDIEAFVEAIDKALS
ncbi:type 1 glutamine amidotransferase domain-containing protein [Psychrobacter sp. FDAARGOS_221]|uniref:type 1 glutamine amidotransferase domain-containing protein n=1 Tax=Psychrobacter sp. FDAARGOS_221 TaxID=1975705 RepID=UPI000BB54295|nr:type 1 glutamine amidotransferase domain-containing protein [Psychrobacter sp. FDAARGOS_221]PNK61859.1 type 1 glutamine amidotransferase [Psychrobacter sp. FDAARGOS_221]